MRISLKFKLLLLLIVLSFVILGVYAVLMLRVFSNDKTAYVYDTILRNSKSGADLLRTEVDLGVTKTQSIVNYYSSSQRQLSEEGRRWFAADSKWSEFVIFQYDQKTGNYVKTVELIRANGLGAAEDTSKGGRDKYHLKDATNLIQLTLRNGMMIKSVPGEGGRWVLSVPVEGDKSSGKLVAVSMFYGGKFLDLFYKPQAQNTYLIGKEGNVILTPRQAVFDLKFSELANIISNLPTNELQHFGVVRSNSFNELVSFADVGFSGLRVISIIPKSIALDAVKVVQRQSVLFFVFLICLATIVSVFGANGLTTSLKRLHGATQEVSKGNLDVSVQVSGSDEISDVSTGFNNMVGEIKRLLVETAEKVRMEGELKTAALIQSTLFPESRLSSKRVELRGVYRPASECCGDLWNFVQVGSKVYAIICDATGHGVPAALVTSAARSAFSIATKLPDVSVGKILEFLNAAIYETLQGKMQMTAFVVCIDQEAGEITFANSSHEPPMLMRKQPEPLKVGDVDFLFSDPGARLGEYPVSSYLEQTMQLKSGDTLLFFTDGLTELRDKNQRELGPRRVIDTVLMPLNQGRGIDDAMAEILKLVDVHRGDKMLTDDITFFMVQYT